MRENIPTHGKRSASLIWGGSEIFSAGDLKRFPSFSRVLLVLTGSYLIVAKSITPISSSLAGRRSHSLFLEQALSIPGAWIYFSFQWCAAVGHLANAGAMPHSTGAALWPFGIPEAFWSCRSFIMPRLVCGPAEPRTLCYARWDWKPQGRCDSTGVRRMEMERKREWQLTAKNPQLVLSTAGIRWGCRYSQRWGFSWEEKEKYRYKSYSKCLLWLTKWEASYQVVMSQTSPNWVQILALPFISCVTLSDLFILLNIHFIIYKMGTIRELLF